MERSDWAAQLAEVRTQANKLDYAAGAMLRKPWWRVLPPVFRRERELAALRHALEEALLGAEHRIRRASTREAWISYDEFRVPQAMAELHATLREIEQHPWWRGAVGLRRGLALLRLRRKEFQMPLDAVPQLPNVPMSVPSPAILGLSYDAQIASKSPLEGGFRGMSSTTSDSNHGQDARATIGVYHTAVSELFPHLPADMQEEVLESEAIIASKNSNPPHTLVSIIMPAWNRQALIPEAIQSVLEQSYPHWELLVCDDGSTDDTAAIAESIPDDRIRVLRLPHAGAARARNAGLAEARGESIAYLDSDNLWHPEYLRVMLCQTENNPERRCAIGNYLDVQITPDGPRLYRRTDVAFSYARLKEKNFIDLNTFFHHRNLYEEFGGFTPDLPRWQDWDLALRYTEKSPPGEVDCYLALYRRNKAWRQITKS